MYKKTTGKYKTVKQIDGKFVQFSRFSEADSCVRDFLHIISVKLANFKTFQNVLKL